MLRDEGYELTLVARQPEKLAAAADGLGVGGSFAGQDTKRIDLQLDVNLRATMLITRESLPFLRESRGSIVILASIAGTIPVPGLAVYGATKAALISLTNSL